MDILYELDATLVNAKHYADAGARLAAARAAPSAPAPFVWAADHRRALAWLGAPAAPEPDGWFTALARVDPEVRPPLLTFIDALLGSPTSPLQPEVAPCSGSVFSANPAQLVAAALQTAPQPPKRYKVTEPANPAFVELCAETHRAKHLRQKTASQNLQLVVKQLTTYEAQRGTWRLKRHRAAQRAIAQEVAKFWKTVNTLAARRHKERMRLAEAEVKAKKRRAWTRRAQLYTKAIWDRLGEAEQEDEDEQLDEEMTSTSGSEDEAECLRREAERPVEEIMAEVEAARQADKRSAQRTSARSKRRRLMLDRLQQRAGSSSSSSESEEPPASSVVSVVEAEPPPPPAPPPEDLKQEEHEMGEEGDKEAEDEEEEVSSLLRATLRSYQVEGFKWLRKLHRGGIAGILADEMGLGKTIQTIALLAHLATEEGIWGPHLIVVPTSVVLNWGIEFRKFAPGLKVITYMGGKKDREAKRRGWSRPFAFNVCVTSYSLALMDAQHLRRLSWYYLVLDEAQNLKNSSSNRWQTLLQYNAVHRLLLTGTPLQNSLMELWSLMYFIVPEVFGKHTDWQDIFSDPLSKAIASNTHQSHMELIQQLYQIIRPFILRRLKRDVEGQLPKKTEHVVRCHLSRKQRMLYDELIAQHSAPKSKSAYMQAMGLLMLLRKVCNHPHLVNESDAESPIFLEGSALQISRALPSMLWVRAEDDEPAQTANLLRFVPLAAQADDTYARSARRALAVTNLDQCADSATKPDQLFLPRRIVGQAAAVWTSTDINSRRQTYIEGRKRIKHGASSVVAVNDPFVAELRAQELDILADLRQNRRRISCAASRRPLESSSLCADTISFIRREFTKHVPADSDVAFGWSERAHALMAPTFTSLFPELRTILCKRFRVRPANTVDMSGPVVYFTELPRGLRLVQEPLVQRKTVDPQQNALNDWLVSSRLLVQPAVDVLYDSGKMIKFKHVLDKAFRSGQKCLVFTQMSKMLDVLERAMNVMGYKYLRLDGMTKPDKRQSLVDQFNNDPKIFAFITSTRAGGVGINLTGASVVIFYDTDWNPAMDRQAMDRCHRLGQTRNVEIYRLICEATIEENIWRKQLEKRLLDEIVVDKGAFTQANYDQTFKPTETTELIFTVNSTDDLYMTRELHEPREELQLAEDPAESALLAAAEDQDDQAALREQKGELAALKRAEQEEFETLNATRRMERDDFALPTPPTVVSAAEPSARMVNVYIDAAVGELSLQPVMAQALLFANPT